LVAEDVAQAQQWAHGSAKRYRVVTLAGVVIDASGAMSGGGRRVARGAMGAQRAADGVSAAEVEVCAASCARNAI
jgi:structural maintenance of chromosome 4